MTVVWPEGAMPREEFIACVCERGAEHYRDLPWRHIDDAYAVLVSEVMLQQTQVARVERFWRRFLAAFPTIDALAAASTSDVLDLWQGLGYNRRALALKKAADICARDYSGELPRTYDELVALPGIGPATAAGVMAFAYQEPGVYLETNVRAVFIHDLFPDEECVRDKQIAPLVADTCPKARVCDGKGALDAPSCGIDPRQSPRDWYYALLDYGAHLKASGANPTRKSAHYAKQSAFAGSRRQKRSWILRRVLAADASAGVGREEVFAELNEAERAAGRDGVERELFDSIVSDLLDEGFFTTRDARLLPS